MREPTLLEQVEHGPLVYYDAIPPDVLPQAHAACKAGLIRIEFDYDRMGYAKTGWVYRIAPTKAANL